MLRKMGRSSSRAGSRRLGAPGIPVDRVVGVLPEVGAGFVGEAIGELWRL